MPGWHPVERAVGLCSHAQDAVRLARALNLAMNDSTLPRKGLATARRITVLSMVSGTFGRVDVGTKAPLLGL